MEELRKKYRIQITDDLSIAAVDTLGTVVLGYVIGKMVGVNPIVMTSLLFVTAIPIHMLTLSPEEQTPLTKKVLEKLDETK